MANSDTVRKRDFFRLSKQDRKDLYIIFNCNLFFEYGMLYSGLLDEVEMNRAIGAFYRLSEKYYHRLDRLRG